MSCKLNNNFLSCLFTGQGRFTIAAKHHITVAEIYESNAVDLEKVSINMFLVSLKISQCCEHYLVYRKTRVKKCLFGSNLFQASYQKSIKVLIFLVCMDHFTKSNLWKQSLFMTYCRYTTHFLGVHPFCANICQFRLYICYLGEFVKNKTHRFQCFSTNY